MSQCDRKVPEPAINAQTEIEALLMYPVIAEMEENEEHSGRTKPHVPQVTKKKEG